MTEKRNASIQLLRICACAMVFVVHFGQQMNFDGIIRDFTDFGAQGVDLFFLISGFLAGKTFFENKNLSVKEYYIKRAIAILPLYYLVILYYFVSENILNHYTPVIPSDELGIGWFRYIFLLNGFLKSDTTFWRNLGITWTIPIFMFFYLIAPWILKKVKSVFSSVLVWFAVFLITKIGGHFYECPIFSNIHLMFLGVVIYICVKKSRSLHAIVVFSSAAICMSIIDNSIYAHVLMFSCIILAFVSVDTINLPTWIQNTINTLDKYSYTMYLIHGVVFCSILNRINTVNASKPLVASIAVLGSLCATWIVGKYIEKPIQSFLKKHTLK